MKIIISRTDKIGDLLLSIPSFYRTRQMFPKAKLIILVREYNFDIVKNLPYVDQVVKIDDYTQKELIDVVRELKVDYFVSLYTDKYIGELAKKSGARFRIGPYSKMHSFFAYNRGVRQKRSRSIKNEAEYNLDLIREIDKDSFEQNRTINTKLYLEKKHYDFAKDYLKGVAGEIIVINPFSAGSAKNLRLCQYKQLVELILRNASFNVLLIGHIKDENEIFENFGDVKNDRLKIFINSDSILYTAALIDASSLYIGGSTGPTHIAGALQKKIIAFYSGIKSQSPLRWGVFNNDNVVYFGNNFDCKERLKCKTRCVHYDCFDKIDLNKVLRASKKIMRG